MAARDELRGADPCVLSSEWRIATELVRRLQLSAVDFWEETRGHAKIRSGYRTKAEQDELRRKGRPTALDELSTHRSCPATGADIDLGVFPTRTQKAIWGRIVMMNGLRWGGGGPSDEGGIPVDWQHVDLGPR